MPEKNTEIKGNGKKDKSDVNKTAVETSAKTGAAQPLPPFMTGNQLLGLMSTKTMPNALDALSQPGETPRQLSMRTILGKKTEGRVLGTALAYHLERCREFEDKLGEEGVLDMEALWVSDEGKGRKQLTDAITGERNHEEGVSGGSLKNILQKGWPK